MAGLIWWNGATPHGPAAPAVDWMSCFLQTALVDLTAYAIPVTDRILYTYIYIYTLITTITTKAIITTVHMIKYYHYHCLPCAQELPEIILPKNQRESKPSLPNEYETII